MPIKSHVYAGFFLITAIGSFGSVSLAPTASATLANLPDGNHRYCDRRPPSDIVDESFLHQNSTWCYLFNKTGNNVFGYFMDTSTFGEYGTCLLGSFDGNVLNGRTIDPIHPDANLTLASLQSESVFDTEGYLKIDDPALERGYVMFNSAVLDLEDFHQYNAGPYAPPEFCRH
ncbi:MAG: hypothetical protein AAGD25_34120 [Cyanobacteria bacterium P01_F01_bin.150]